MRGASLRAAAENPGDEFHAETLGVSPRELGQLQERLARHRETPEPVDPVVSFLVGATSGYLYTEQIGRLETVPIPELRLPPGEGRLLLDIGCNWGRWSMAAAKLGWRVVGVDPSLGAVLAARRLAAHLGLAAEFVVGDALSLPFAKESFDAVFSYSVLQHFSKEDAASAVAQAARVSRAGATLLVQMPNKFGIRCLQHQATRRFREPRGFEVRYYTPGELRRVFGENYGPASLSVDNFLGLGIQASDRHLMAPSKRFVVDVSEALRKASNVLPPLRHFADSVYVTARREGPATSSS